MKKTISLLLVVMFVCFAFSGCFLINTKSTEEKIEEAVKNECLAHIALENTLYYSNNNLTYFSSPLSTIEDLGDDTYSVRGTLYVKQNGTKYYSNFLGTVEEKSDGSFSVDLGFGSYYEAD